MGRRGRDDPERHGRGPGRERERSEGGAGRRAGGDHQDEDLGYKDRVHERLDRMDRRLESLEQRLEGHLKGGDA